MVTANTSTGPDWLDRRLKNGEAILLDGAMGTELQARGVPMHTVGWSAGALFEHADVVQKLHEDYIRAGADVIIANTFATSRHMLEPAGYGEQLESLNKTAVKAALQARDNCADRPVAVAGSMSNFMADPHDSYWLEPARLRSTYTEQAEILAAAGVDIIALEMLQRPPIAQAAVAAALATGLPVWVGVSCKVLRPDSPLVTFNFPEYEFEQVIAAVLQPGIAVINVMHSEIPDTIYGLEAVRKHWSGPLGAYPEAGYFDPPTWEFVEIDEAILLKAVRTWLDLGVQIIGGCCGLGVQQIQLLSKHLGKSRDCI